MKYVPVTLITKHVAVSLHVLAVKFNCLSNFTFRARCLLDIRPMQRDLRDNSRERTRSLCSFRLEL